MLTSRFVVISALFVTVLITANLIAVKLITVKLTLGDLVLFDRILPAAIIIFPVSYIIGDVLTEVYGYRMARRVIWLGFLCNTLSVLFIWLGQLLPPASVR